MTFVEQDRIAEPQTAEARSASAPVGGIGPVHTMLLQLQHSAGNQAVARMIMARQQAAAARAVPVAEPTDEPNPFENEAETDEEAPDGEPPLGPEDMLEAPAVDEGDTPAGGGGREQAIAQQPFQPPEPDKEAVLARSVMLSDPATPGTRRAMTRAQREAFVRARFRGRRRRIAYEVVRDMAATSNALNFDTEDELYVEVLKRVTSSIVMQDSQDGERRTGRSGESYTAHAFGYPFTGGSLLYGPRVNFAAKDYWAPNPPDSYAVRTDSTKNRQLRSLPRGQRHTVYGDAGASYSFGLTPAGEADFFSAITKLFIPQPPHKRALIHCDYLISLVHLRSFAATIGQSEFNRRATTYGPSRLQLRWNLFSDLEFDPAGGGAPGPLASLQVVHPANEDDLIIGDHVYYWNHRTYDLLNEGIGNAWRLENTILIDRRSGADVFLGHGSGRMSKNQLRAKLADEYNDVADRALRLAHRADRGDAAATSEMVTSFPNVKKVSGVWRVMGSKFGAALDIELRRIHGSEVLGPYDPWNPARMYAVRRPIESA